MKFKTEKIGTDINILANDHFVAVPYDCTELEALATEGVIPAGTIVPANDVTAVGVLLHDVNLGENPNGVAVIHGFINLTKLPTAPATTVNMKQITFIE